MKSDCSRPSDRIAILKGIEDSIGFTKLDRMVFEVLDRWQLKTLSEQARVCESLGLEHASWFNSLGRMFYEQGRISDAEKCFSKAAAAASNATESFEVLNLMATTNVAVARYVLAHAADHAPTSSVFSAQKAKELLEDTVDACRKSLHPQHALLNTAILQLADMHCQSGEVNIALDLYHEALRSVHGSAAEMPSVIATLGLALLAQEKTQYKESVMLFADLYSKLKDMVGADHPVSIMCRIRQALCIFEARTAPSIIFRFIHFFTNFHETCVCPTLSRVSARFGLRCWLEVCCLACRSALVDFCGLQSERDSYYFLDDKTLRMIHPVDIYESNVHRQVVSGNEDELSLISETSDFLYMDIEYAMLADSFERCTRVFGSQHPLCRSSHAWLQLVEAFKRQQHSASIKLCWKRNFANPLFFFFVVLMIYACVVLPWSLQHKRSAIQEWQVTGSSVIELPSTSMRGIPAVFASFSRQHVPYDFQFDGNVVFFGTRNRKIAQFYLVILLMFLIFVSGTACAPPLPTNMRAKRTVAVIESGNCEWGAKVGTRQF
jgi:tetratricopeptide (TPR) repeat protein